MSTIHDLEFERPVRDLEARIRDLGREPTGAPPGVEPLDEANGAARSETIRDLEKQRDVALRDAYAALTPADTVLVARHRQRPQTRDYIDRLCRDFCELHGDRRFGDDPAIVAGFGRIGMTKVLIVGHHKGRDTQEKIACHFGCAHPEGYRKALAKMKLAEKFHVPIVTLVDTPGAYPGIEAEERGQAEAIAVNLREMSRLRTPIVSVIIGEGGSGGALGIAVADRVGMLAHAWYSVISPEGCAAILWKQSSKQTNDAAASALRITARDNLSFGIIDAIIDEPIGGAHRDPERAASLLETWIVEQLQVLRDIPMAELLEARFARFRKLGQYEEAPAPAPAPVGVDDAAPDPECPDSDGEGLPEN